jgi:hypothetical protein
MIFFWKLPSRLRNIGSGGHAKNQDTLERGPGKMYGRKVKFFKAPD